MPESTYRQPFPGMDPYLEAPSIWPDFHEALAVNLRERLNLSLPAPYYSRVQARPETGIIVEEGTVRRISPDGVVMRRPPPGAREPRGDYVALAAPRIEATPGIDLRVPTEEVRHPFVEIRDPTHGHKLITVIEIVSPSNKRPGPDRRSYEVKQREILDSDANLIEIDLLRTGRRLLPYPELEATVHELNCAYPILINRSTGRPGLWMDYMLYPIKLRDVMPVIPVPLTAERSDVPLDMQFVVGRTYQGGPYLRSVDYAAQPDPPLNDEDAAWADERLRAAGLR